MLQKALIIGINYTGSKHEIDGCIDEIGALGEPSYIDVSQRSSISWRRKLTR